MKSIRFNQRPFETPTSRPRKHFLAIVAAFALGAVSAAAIEIDFDQAGYTVDPGDTLELTVALDQPVPNGLDAYALRLSFPTGTVSLDESDIAIVSELDHDLFAEGPADRNVTGASATLRGFADLSEGAYSGTAFVTFHVTVPINAPGGDHQLQLGLADPDGNNFVDGARNVIDTELVFGTAALNIVVPVPETIDPLSLDPLTGSVSAAFRGIPGRDYRIQASTNLQDWSTIRIVTADQTGAFGFTDTDAPDFPRRFYRARTD